VDFNKLSTADKVIGASARLPGEPGAEDAITGPSVPPTAV
jgi:hypothetical protein